MRHASLIAAIIALVSLHARGQGILTGRLLAERSPGSTERIPMSAVLCFGSPAGSESQAMAFRTWETHPAGWYRLCGPGGRYTILFTTPGYFLRPIIRTNLYLRDGETVNRDYLAAADYAIFDEAAWDTKGATEYFQGFVPTGRSLTHVGFRLVHDGIDGAGPGRQNLRVSIHAQTEDPPERWPQVGPERVVMDVDSGGGKNYQWAAGWNSGEVEVVPGRPYAVRLRAETAGNHFQAFWRPAKEGERGCYRRGMGNEGWTKHDLWMSVATDNDGLCIPYNKRVQSQFAGLTRFARKWSQTYVARGRGLAGVVLYAACSGVQPSMNRQRVVVRIRAGGVDGPVVGLSKIAIGNGNYTGDASWGTFGAAFAPGEVPLRPGELYAVEFESLENYSTLHGYVNIKKQVSDDKPGFNPYRKHPRETYEPGRAYMNGRDAVEEDLDMQIIEYEAAAMGWEEAMEEKELLRNGDMESAGTGAEAIADWRTFSVDPETAHQRFADGPEERNHLARILGGSATGRTTDGGYVQRVENLSGAETYRLMGRLRSSWPLDDKHQCRIGFDPTGQVDDPGAATIVWTLLPAVHGVFVDYRSEPIRPAKNAISVWLRAKTTLTSDFPFRADFDDFSLRQVRTSIPQASKAN